MGRESKELLSLCLKKIRGLKELTIVEAGFVWTEEHCRRVKVRLTVRKEV
jgi:nonsense-mediated mRNA decay protein 3